MLKPGTILTCLLLVLAGCSAGPRRATGPRAPDWNLGEDAAGARGTPSTQSNAVPISAGTTNAPANPARTNYSYAQTWIPLARWGQENHWGSFRRLSPASSPTFLMAGSNGILVVQANSLLARWDDLQLHLGFEPQLIGDQPFVHTLDLKNNIQPLMSTFALPAKTNRVVVIDPGHGGASNPGTQSVLTGTGEKEFTLDWARRLAPLLAASGWRVFLTRTGDVDMSLSERIAFADQHQADLFISLHFNSAAPNREQAGLETFCLTPTGMPSTLVRDSIDDVSLVYPNNAFDAENLKLAVQVHRALLERVDGIIDRGVRRARFMSVVRGQKRPAVLVEGGYLSNPREARLIGDPAYRQALAEALASSLADKTESNAQKAEQSSAAVASPAATVIPKSTASTNNSSPD